MNEPPIQLVEVNADFRALIRDALAAFTRSTGLPAELVAETPLPVGDWPAVDAAVAVHSGSRRFAFMADAKFTVDRRVALADAKNSLAPYRDEGLLIARHVTHALARECREKLDLQFMDASGNTYLKREGLFVYVTGERRVGEQIDIATPGTTAWLKVVFALLCRPMLRSVSYRDLAAASRVALGIVGPVFAALEAHRYVVPNTTRGARTLIEPGRLFREWVMNYPTRLRPKLRVQRLRAERADWWRDVELRDLDAHWGGEVAAAKLTGHLKPTTCTIYVAPEQRRQALQHLAGKHRLRADPTGDVEILDAFWRFPAAEQEHDGVPPVLVYADLMASLDPRNLEVAELIRERYLKDAFGGNAFGSP